jgi:sugar lactone lactonase YvrE
LISTASYASKSFSVAAQDTVPTDLFFKPDGTKLYVCGQTNDRIYQYSLSTAWDISTASYDNVQLNTGLNPNTFFLAPDGTKLYSLSTTTVFQYALSTPWLISSGTLDKSYDFSASTNPAETNGIGLAFSQDGSKMFIVGAVQKFIYEFSLSTNWDVSTASPIDYIRYYVYQQDSTPTGLCFSTDGESFYVAGDATNRIYQYSVYP